MIWLKISMVWKSYVPQVCADKDSTVSGVKITGVGVKGIGGLPARPEQINTKSKFDV